MCRRSRNRRGLSLVELLTATAILVLMAGAIAALASTVQTSSRHGQGHGIATQHARVALERIERAVHKATASSQFPGCVVFAETSSGFRFPDTLVVWHPPTGTASNPGGLPLFSELVIFRVDQALPNRLVEITVPGHTQTVPAISDESQWTSELNNLRTQPSYQQVTLTDLLRTATVSSGEQANTNIGRRGVVRFNVEQTPSDGQLADYKNGLTAWKDLPWAQGICGTKTGLRQGHCRIELQLLPGKASPTDEAVGLLAVPFFGSAALFYEVRQ